MCSGLVHDVLWNTLAVFTGGSFGGGFAATTDDFGGLVDQLIDWLVVVDGVLPRWATRLEDTTTRSSGGGRCPWL